MKQTRVFLVDDIDGSEAARTISFSVNGVDYEIDLNDDNGARFEEEIGKWVAVARRVGGRQRRGAGAPSGPSVTARAREWAKSRGIEVNERGRISNEVMAMFLAENS